MIETATGRLRALVDGCPTRDPECSVNSVALAPRGDRLATVSDAHLGMVWSVDGAPIATLSGHAATVVGVAIDPTGGVIATASADGDLRLWDANTGRPLRRIRDAGGTPTARTTSVAFSPDGARLVSGHESSARVWDARTGHLLATVPTSFVFAVAFAPDGARVAAGDRAGVVRVWAGAPDAAQIEVVAPPAPAASPSLRRAPPPSPAPAATITARSTDGALAARGDGNGVVTIVDGPTDRVLFAFTAHGGAVTRLAFDGDALVTEGDDATRRRWTLAPERRAPADVLADVQRATPWRLVGGRLTDAPP